MDKNGQALRRLPCLGSLEKMWLQTRPVSAAEAASKEVDSWRPSADHIPQIKAASPFLKLDLGGILACLPLSTNCATCIHLSIYVSAAGPSKCHWTLLSDRRPNREILVDWTSVFANGFGTSIDIHCHYHPLFILKTVYLALINCVPQKWKTRCNAQRISLHTDCQAHPLVGYGITAGHFLMCIHTMKWPIYQLSSGIFLLIQEVIWNCPSVIGLSWGRDTSKILEYLESCDFFASERSTTTSH